VAFSKGDFMNEEGLFEVTPTIPVKDATERMEFYSADERDALLQQGFHCGDPTATRGVAYRTRHFLGESK
jgi:hypothetical protein